MGIITFNLEDIQMMGVKLGRVHTNVPCPHSCTVTQCCGVSWGGGGGGGSILYSIYNPLR